MFLFKICHPLWRFHFRKLIILFTVSVFFFTVLKLFASDKSDTTTVLRNAQTDAVLIPIDSEDALVADPSLDTALSHRQCPLCFGDKFCWDVRDNVALLNDTHPIQLKENRVIYRATWKTTETVLVKAMTALATRNFRRHLCQMARLPINCHLSSAVANTYSSFKDKNLNKIDALYEYIGRNRSDIPFALCFNDKLNSILETIFDEDENGNVTEFERSMLLTTLALNPEALTLRFLTYINTNLPIVHYYGSCGRTWLIETGLTPLKDFLREPFIVRANLAAKILQMVDDFLEDDPDWSMLFTGFYYDNLAVNKNDEVMILNIEDLVVVDKSIIQPSEELEESIRDPCNQECFRKFSRVMTESPSTEHVCSLLPQYAELMYAIICQQILSNLDEHRVEHFFEMDGYNNNPKKVEDPGLLHGIPENSRDSIEELLRECVLETSGGGRVQAAEELRDLLSELSVIKHFFNSENGDYNKDADEDDLE